MYNNCPRNRNAAYIAMRQAQVLVCLVFAAVSLAGCTYDRGMGSPQIHYAEFRVAAPDGDGVEVWQAYTCQMTCTFSFRSKDIADIAGLMNKTKRSDTPFEERRAIAYAIGLIETKTRAKLGIKDKTRNVY